MIFVLLFLSLANAHVSELMHRRLSSVEAQEANLAEMQSLRSALYAKMNEVIANGELTELGGMQAVLDKTEAKIDAVEVKLDALYGTDPLVSGYVGAMPAPAPKPPLKLGAFCDDRMGGTSMYMQGFMPLSSIMHGGPGGHPRMCPTYLFQEWVLSTRTKYALAATFTWVVAILTEGLVGFRRYAKNELELHKVSVPLAFLCTAALYAVHLTMGYLLMLISMMYQTELFIILVFGLVCGHCLFNWKAPIADSIDPCCQTDLPMTTLKQPLVTPEEVGAVPNDGAKSVLDVQGMTCMKNCGSTVQGALMLIKGVQQVLVDIPTGKVTVLHAKQVKTADLVDAVDTVGFDCTLQSTDSQCRQLSSDALSHSFDSNSSPFPPGIGSSLLR